MKKRQGFYSISVVAKMFSVHQQTIRMYEKEGLLTPKRSDGNTRLFSEEDVDRLEEIINLTHKMGVNLAGVEVILKLQKKLARMQQEMNKLFGQLEGEIASEADVYKADVRKQAERLVEMKQQVSGTVSAKQAEKSMVVEVTNKKKQRVEEVDEPMLPSHQQEFEEVDDWKIDYDDHE